MEQVQEPARRGYAFAWSAHRNPEREQATLRVWMGAMVLVAYLAYAWFHPTHDAAEMVIFVAVYVAYGAASLIAVRTMAGPSRVRLVITTIADQALVAIGIAIGGPLGLPLLWVVFWFLIGSGCRYGKTTLAVSCATALVAISALAAWQPWWQANRPAALGVALSVLGASVYLSVLVDRLGNANRDLARQASTDPLTGLSNRYALEQTVGRAMSAIATDAADMSALLLIDLDGFKEVNDTYGHGTGDLLLQGFAALLTRRMRKTDTVARLGGDEFVVLARHVPDRAAVLAVADSIHAMLATLTSVEDRSVRVSASVGACMIHGGVGAQFRDIATLMRAADRAMYRAKTLGQGQTVFADGGDFETG
jgi:diguanylate cyclase (GGDEF)-like protein